MWNNFDIYLIKDYINILKNESKNYNNNLIYLVTTTIYKNFTITIYPLDIEEFVYNKHFIYNNFGFINFTKVFSNFVEYKINKKLIILIILLESHSKNTSINDLNYYFYAFNEKYDKGTYNNEIKIKEIINILLKDELSQLEVLYPLHYYYSKSIINNINKIYYIYPDVELTNISDPFYNDICLIYKTDVNTDIILNDRRNEYFLNISLCEYNCTFVKFINKGLNNLRTLCNCRIKEKIIFNNISKENEIFPSISVSNAKAITCINELFTKYNLLSNINFWVILFIFILQLIILNKGYCSVTKEIIILFKINNNYISKENKNTSKLNNNSIDNNSDNPQKNIIEDNFNIEDEKEINAQKN